MKLDGYSFQLCQELVDNCYSGLFPTLFTYSHVWTLLINNPILSMMKTSLVLVIQLFLTYLHAPDKARMNKHQASYLVSICLIFVFLPKRYKVITACWCKQPTSNVFILYILTEIVLELNYYIADKYFNQHLERYK